MSPSASFSREVAFYSPSRDEFWRVLNVEAPRERFPYVWFWRAKHGDRKGQRCRVWARGTMNSIGVEWPDGFRTVTSRYAIRRAQ